MSTKVLNKWKQIIPVVDKLFVNELPLLARITMPMKYLWAWRMISWISISSPAESRHRILFAAVSCTLGIAD